MQKTIMMVLGGGGHSDQIMTLSKRLEKRCNIEYVVKKDAKSGKGKLRGKIFRIMNPRTMQDKNSLLVILKLVPYTIQALNILSKSKARAIVICGPAVSIPLAFLGKILFRKKLIFIESWSRVKTKSLSGKLIGRFADLILVQWKENKSYGKSIYAGRLG